MKPAAYAFWAAAAAVVVVPVQALRCEAGFDDGDGWEYSDILVQAACTHLKGTMEEEGEWPRCIYFGTIEEWQSTCRMLHPWVIVTCFRMEGEDEPEKEDYWDEKKDKDSSDSDEE